MKIVSFNDCQIGLLADDQLVEITEMIDDDGCRQPQDRIFHLIERFDILRPQLESALTRAEGIAVDSVKILAPIVQPKNIVCMAVNYMEDGTLKEPAPINAFHKAPSSVIGHGGTMVLPDVGASVFEGEAELALVIGKRASHVKAADALSHVFGYMNFIDGSARGLGPPSNFFFQMKSRDTFAPMGPYLVTADEIENPQALQVRLWNNGELMQNFNTSDMAHSIARCIEWVSSIHTLEPGDILATGTNHRGLHPFEDGQEIELEVQGLGRLHVGVSDPLKRTWLRQTRLQRQELGLITPTPPQQSGKYTPSQ